MTSQLLCTFLLFLQLGVQAGPPLIDMEDLSFTVCCNEYPGMLNVVRNTTGQVLFRTGVSVEMLEWMARRFHFKYECAPLVGIILVDNTSTAVGNMFYVQTGYCFLSVGPTVILHHRTLYVDFLTPFMIEPVVMLIPKPVSSYNMSAIWQPFNIHAWILLLSFVFVVILVLNWLDRFDRTTEDISHRIRLSHWIFVVGLLLARAAQHSSHKLTLRFVAASWCLAVVVVTAIYSSALIAFIVAPNFRPLINTVEDLAQTDNVRLVVYKNLATDITITQSPHPLMKKLAGKLAKYSPSSRCSDLPKCTEEVKKGSTAFIHQYGPVVLAIGDDLRETGECNLALAKELFNSYTAAWAIRKHSPLLEDFNRGTLAMVDTGLVKAWRDQYQPKPNKCFSPDNKHSLVMEEIRHPPRLSLKNLTGAFAALAIGYVLCFMVFICENIIHFTVRMSQTAV